MFHTDQGYLYTNPVFSHKLKKLGFTQSLSRKGNCLDNAVIESFNGTMKCEWFYPRYNKARWDLSFDDASTFVMEYVKYYNEERIQKKLGIGLSDSDRISSSNNPKLKTKTVYFLG